MDSYYQSLYQAYQNSGKYTQQQLKELEIGLSRALEVEFYANPLLSAEQMAQIRLGLEHGIDVTPYASASWYHHRQMAEIREGIEAGIDISYYDDVSYSAEQMHIIRLGLQANLDVTWYTNPIFSISQAGLIYEGLRQGLDVRFYADPGYEAEQMLVIKKGLESNVNVSIYADNRFSFMQMTQIRQGLELGLNVSLYAKFSYDEKQMWQIKSGLIDGLDVSCYANPQFHANQMQEIRLGLKSGIDIALYCDPTFTYEEMRQVRTIFTRHRKPEKKTTHTVKFPEEKIERMSNEENYPVTPIDSSKPLPPSHNTYAHDSNYPDTVLDNTPNSEAPIPNKLFHNALSNGPDFRFNETNTHPKEFPPQAANETVKSSDFSHPQFYGEKPPDGVHLADVPVFPDSVPRFPDKMNSENSERNHTISDPTTYPVKERPPILHESEYRKEPASSQVSRKPPGAPEDIKPKQNVFQIMSNAAKEGRPAMSPKELFSSGKNVYGNTPVSAYSAPHEVPLSETLSDKLQA